MASLLDDDLLLFSNRSDSAAESDRSLIDQSSKFTESTSVASAVAGQRTVSLSTSREDSLITADQLILVNGPRIRSHSQPGQECTFKQNADIWSHQPMEKIDFWDQFGGAPPKLERRVIPPAQPACIKPIMSDLTPFIRAHDQSSIPSSSTATTDINGYIKHETRSELTAADSFHETWSSCAKKKQQQSSSADLIESIHSSEEWKGDDEDEDEDEVFDSGKRDVQRKPLLGHSSYKRVRFSRTKERVSLLTAGPDDEDFSLARIKQARHWRSRVFWLVSCLLMNLLASVVVGLFMYGIDTLRPFSGDPTVTLPAVCPDINTVYVANVSTPWTDLARIAGHSRLISAANNQMRFLIPIVDQPEDMFQPIGVILAFETNSLKYIWKAQFKGPITSIICGEDVNLDGVEDCILTTDNPSTFEILSGSDGSRISWLVDDSESSSIKLLSPRWLPDVSNDHVADVLLTVSDKQSKTIDFVAMASQKVANGVEYSKSTLFTIQSNETTKQSAEMWRGGDGQSVALTVYEAVPGIYIWNEWDFLRGRFEYRLPLFQTVKFGTPIGVFAELNGDGVTELVSCLSDGTVAAFDRIANKLLWMHTHPNASCLPASLAVGRFVLTQAPSVAVAFKYKLNGATEIYIIDGMTGSKIRSSIHSTSSFDSVPIVLNVNGPSQDKVVAWRVKNSRIELVASGYPWNQESVLFSTDLISNGVQLTSGDVLEQIKRLNQRFTGSLYGSPDGSVNLFFATNSPDATVIVHHLRMTCDCSKEPKSDDKCASFSKVQRWRSYMGQLGDGYLA